MASEGRTSDLLAEPQGEHGEFVEGLVFVGMAFDVPSNISDIYQAIRRACQNVELNAKRVDDIPGVSSIPTAILRSIEDAEFLIFDLTGANPNVYYELGYAHGVGNTWDDILLIAKQGTELLFDIAHLSVMFYASATDLEQKLPEKLIRMINSSRA